MVDVQPDHAFISSDRVITIRRYGPVFAGVYYQGLTETSLREVLEWQRGVIPDEKIISFSLAFAAELLEPDVKDAADRLLREFAAQTRASATVLSAAGFQAAAARAMLATIYLLVRSTYPRKAFSTVSDAETWLMEQADEGGGSIYAAARWLLDEESNVAGARQARPG